MKTFIILILHLIIFYFIGGFLFLLLNFITSGFPRFFHWTFSLPYWGLGIVFLVFGYVAWGIYQKLPKSKED